MSIVLNSGKTYVHANRRDAARGGALPVPTSPKGESWRLGAFPRVLGWSPSRTVGSLRAWEAFRPHLPAEGKISMLITLITLTLAPAVSIPIPVAAPTPFALSTQAVPGYTAGPG
jgi:hypothetical protein